MIVEKEIKVDINNIDSDSRAGDLESDCSVAGEAGGTDNPTSCFRDVSIAYINVGNASINNTSRRIGVVLNGETQANENFVLELGFKTWQDIDTSDPIRNKHYTTMMNFVEEALLTGIKADICVNSKNSDGYRIIDIALKK